MLACRRKEPPPSDHRLNSFWDIAQSKWSSSQAAEKLLKCFLRSSEIDFPRSHNLRALSKLAAEKGVKIDDAEIEHASANTGLRYGESSATQVEATLAHYASLVIAQRVHQTMRAHV